MQLSWNCMYSGKLFWRAFEHNSGSQYGDTLLSALLPMGKGDPMAIYTLPISCSTTVLSCILFNSIGDQPLLLDLWWNDLLAVAQVYTRKVKCLVIPAVLLW